MTDRDRRNVITWLHCRAEEMNDPKARALVNLLASDFGNGYVPKGLKARNIPAAIRKPPA